MNQSKQNLKIYIRSFKVKEKIITFLLAENFHSFFLLSNFSGFLLSYLYFESYMKKPKKDGVIAFLKSVCNRILRIAPSYYTIILFSMIIGIYLKDKSQFNMLENIEENCIKFVCILNQKKYLEKISLLS